MLKVNYLYCLLYVTCKSSYYDMMMNIKNVKPIQIKATAIKI